MLAAPELVAPAHLWVPPHASSSGSEVAELADLAGMTLDPEQRLALDVLLAEDEAGRWAALEGALVVARQNIKTHLLRAMVLGDLFLFDARLVVWTAHLFSTTQEAFRDLDATIAGTPELSRRVVRVSRANGEEGFELEGDRRLMFRARSKTGGRGLTGDVVILDEAFALTAAEMGSLLPTLSARPNPRVTYASSAGLIGSALLRRVRDRGRKGGDPSLAYVEWCAPEGACEQEDCDHHFGAEGCAADDEEMWRRANPALGRRIMVEFVRAERLALPPEEFVRERLGWWDEPAAGEDGIPADVWVACADRTAGLDEPCVLGVDVSPGQASGAIVAYGGAAHVVEHRRGTSWIVPRLLELQVEHKVALIGLNPTGPAGALLKPLEEAGMVVIDGGPLRLVNGQEMAQACEGFLAAVLDGSFVHRDEASLNIAVEGAGRVAVGDSWRWSRRTSTADISPLVAATVARHLWLVLPDSGGGQILW